MCVCVSRYVGVCVCSKKCDDMHMLKSPLLCAYDWIFIHITLCQVEVCFCAKIGTFWKPINVMF